MMCVIVDACVRDDFFSSSPSPAAAKLRDWIENHGGKIVYGGKLATELSQSERARKELKGMWQRGQALQVLRAAVEAECINIKSLCKSNDIHIVALARLSGARCVFSVDSKSGLVEDMHNAQLIDAPRGKIYKTADQADRLLRHSTACKYGEGTRSCHAATHANDGAWYT